MISSEPTIAVGIVERAAEVHVVLNGQFTLPDGRALEGEFCIRNDGGVLSLLETNEERTLSGPTISLHPEPESTFTLRDVTIGIQFHWERKEDQTFCGSVRFIPDAGAVTAINDVGVEEYLKSVIASEMSAEAPLEFLKAHAITSRSWLVAMLERQLRGKNVGVEARRSQQTGDEIVRWYDREDHAHFDVCADDHCQRYQGMSAINSPRALEAVEATRGMFLVYGGTICDARFSKVCGGLTENFENAWEDTPIPYLQSVSDAEVEFAPIRTEEEARRWIKSKPPCFCNTVDAALLAQILPSFDRETKDFFRWRVEYRPEELEELIRSKSGIDFGTLMDLKPIARGPSGRIVKLRVEGTKNAVTVGKELEIRRWLSKSHLYSSAFVVDMDRDERGIPRLFVLRGAGWGHGVGLCQIGAAVMATAGRRAEEIVGKYFRGATIQRLY